MAKDLPKILGGIVGPYIQPDQAIGIVAELPVEEILVLGEESHAPLSMKKRKYVIIFDSKIADMLANLTKRYSPIMKDELLVVREVFVQQVQAAANAVCPDGDVSTNLPRLSSQAWRESLTASATAAKAMRPPQRVLHMNSQERPSATSSRTCQTMIRVPLKVGFPWQISGSATIYWPSSSRCPVPCRALLLPLFVITPKTLTDALENCKPGDPGTPARKTLLPIYFTIDHEPCFTGSLDRCSSRARHRERPEHSHQPNVWNAAALSVSAINCRLRLMYEIYIRRLHEAPSFSAASLKLTPAFKPGADRSEDFFRLM